MYLTVFSIDFHLKPQRQNPSRDFAYNEYGRQYRTDVVKSSSKLDSNEEIRVNSSSWLMMYSTRYLELNDILSSLVLSYQRLGRGQQSFFSKGAIHIYYDLLIEKTQKLMEIIKNCIRDKQKCSAVKNFKVSARPELCE